MFQKKKESQGYEYPNASPDEGFTGFYNVYMLIKYAQINKKHQNHKKDESGEKIKFVQIHSESR
jgi:hypothetical protein